MPTTINDLYEAFSKIDIRSKLPEIIQAKQYGLVTKILKQHETGINGTGAKITPAYGSKYYSKFKAALNPAAGYGTPDIKVTGAYGADLHVTVKGDEYEVESAVDYAKSASITQYGNDLNLPTEASKEEFWQEDVAPAILEYVKQETGL